MLQRACRLLKIIIIKKNLKSQMLLFIFRADASSLLESCVLAQIPLTIWEAEEGTLLLSPVSNADVRGGNLNWPVVYQMQTCRFTASVSIQACTGSVQMVYQSILCDFSTSLRIKNLFHAENYHRSVPLPESAEQPRNMTAGCLTS